MTVHDISVQELEKLKQEHADFLLLDVRDQSEYDICNLGGKLIPLQELPNHVNELNRDQQIVVHCKLGGRSRRAAEFLVQQGFTNVHNLSGGIMAWIEKIDPLMTKY